MDVSFRRTTVQTVKEARKKISLLRQELHRAQDFHRRMITHLSHPATIGYLYQIIAASPEYEAELLRLGETLSDPIRQYIHTIINQAKEKYGAR